MLDTPATFIAMAGTAFLVASYGSATWEARSAPVRDAIPLVSPIAGKGDRLQAPRPNPVRSSVTTVEIVGLSQAIVVLRSRDGTILYRSDPLSHTTMVSKDANLPVVTLKEVPHGPAVQRTPTPQDPTGPTVQEESDRPASDPGRKPRTVGCESPVSPLARGAPDQAPGRCLADAGLRVAL